MIIYNGYRIFNFKTPSVMGYTNLKLIYKNIGGTWYHVNTFRNLTDALNYCVEE